MSRGKLFLPLVALMLQSALTFAEIDATRVLEFGDSLAANRDYFRAISVYKFLRYSSDEPTEEIDFRISSAYYESGYFDLAAAGFRRLAASQLDRDGISARATLMAGLSEMRRGNSGFAIQLWAGLAGTSYARSATTYQALGFSAVGDWEESLAIVETLEASGEPAGYRGCSSLSQPITATLAARTPNAVLAGALSAAIPGLGQIYAEHPYDGLLAFLSVGTLGFVSYASWRYESTFSDAYRLTPAAITLTALFYAANIRGAVMTSRYRAQRVHEDGLSAFESCVMAAAPPPLPAAWDRN